MSPGRCGEIIDFPAFSYTSGITTVTVPLFNYYGMRKPQE